MMTYMANNIIGRQPQWKKISMEDKINGRRHQWKTTSMQDDHNGRQGQWKTTTMIKTFMECSNQFNSSTDDQHLGQSFKRHPIWPILWPLGEVPL